MEKNMSKYKHLKHLSSSFIFLFTFCFCINANATLLNSDFSSGFDDWQAEVEYIDGTSGLDEIDDGNIIASFPDSFSSFGNSATLTTAFDGNNGNELWSVLMYQDFMFDSIMAGSSLWLSLDVIFVLTDGGTFPVVGDPSTGFLDDFAFAQLVDDLGNVLLDLSTGGTFDVTAWAGIDVALEFGVIDNDFLLGDALTVSNIVITEVKAAQVPSPATLFLYILGIVLLKRIRA
jgi:hypothetical protein